MKFESLRELIVVRFGGMVGVGANPEGGGIGCIFEQHSVWLGIPWTDDPTKNKTFDFRALNDSCPTDAARAEWMPLLMDAFEGALDWPRDRQLRVAGALTVWTVRELVAGIPELSRQVADECSAAIEVQSAVAAAFTATVEIYKRHLAVGEQLSRAALGAAESAWASNPAPSVSWAASAAAVAILAAGVQPEDAGRPGRLCQIAEARLRQIVLAEHVYKSWIEAAAA